MMDNTNTLNRRDVLKLAGAAGAALTVWQFVPLISGSEETTAHKWVMVIDLEKCIGCGYCTMACQAHNDISPDIRWNKIYDIGEKTNGEKAHMAVPCQHCEHAPCVEACPVKATYHRADGIVMMDYDRCIGCRYCEVACPYGARSFNWETFDGVNPAVPEWGDPEVPRRPRGVVEKCGFCYQRIDRGLAQGLTPGVDDDATPACVVACPVGARIFGDLNDPNSEVSQVLAREPHERLREDLGTETRVYYLPLNRSVEETVS
jgi:phenylacetyl-CoA:acceptor oxidoreductase subunit 1